MKSSCTAKTRISERCGDYLSSYLFSDGQPCEGSDLYISLRLTAASTEKKPRGSISVNVFGTANLSCESAFRKIFKIF